MQLKLTLDTQPVDRLLAEVPRDVPRVIARALNKTSLSAKAQALKTLATELGSTQRVLRSCIYLCKASPVQLTAVLGVEERKPLPLIALDPKAKETLVGVSYRGPGGLRRTVPAAFIARMPSGHRGIFMRRGKARLPLRELTGPSISKVFGQPNVQEQLARVVEQRWPVVLAQEVNYALLRQIG